jgi:transcriptional regulator with XRE-family HTH domain
MRKGWSLEKLGGRVGIKRAGMSRIELGGPTTMSRLEAIARELGVTVADLLPESRQGEGV